jgi:hypothetical protein
MESALAAFLSGEARPAQVFWAGYTGWFHARASRVPGSTASSIHQRFQGENFAVLRLCRLTASLFLGQDVPGHGDRLKTSAGK